MHALIYSMLVDRVLQGIRIYVPEFSGMKPGDRVLDVCCGTGAQTFHYARLGIISSGIDLDHRMIEFAEKSRIGQRLPNVSFQRASALDLPFQDESFDYASITMALHEKEEAARDRIISEMQRVVKKGGILVFVDYRVPYPQSAYGYFVKAAELMAGKDHFRYFRDYIKQGGLDSLLSRNHLHEEKRSHARRMPLVIVTVRRA